LNSTPARPRRSARLSCKAIWLRLSGWCGR
jgi:hypothetical protein